MSTTEDSPATEVKHKRSQGPHPRGGSREARRRSALILEVLAGERTPSEAASVLGVSVPRFYAIESQALEGMVAACEPRRRGPRDNPEREVLTLRKELARSKREQARSQALLRLAQRSVGVPSASKARADGAGKKRRKPTVRALKAAAALDGGGAEGLSVVDGDGKTA